jgi:outer membrane protein assembly factor BamB
MLTRIAKTAVAVVGLATLPVSMLAVSAGGASVSAGGESGPAQPAVQAAATTAPQLRYSVAWKATTKGVIALSSPIPATVDGVSAIVVGTRGGQVLALDQRTGAALPHWPITTPGALPVDSTPSVNGSVIYVGVGDAGHPANGGYLALNATNGSRRFYTQVDRKPHTSSKSGVSAGMTVAVLQGKKTVTAGSMGQYDDSLNATTGRAMKGFPWFSSDTELSTPAVTNLYRNGRNYIVSGAEQTAGTALGHHYVRGGHLRVLASTGNAGTKSANGGLSCDYTPNQGVQSSPAVGTFLTGHAVGIVVGTSDDFAGASDTGKLIALTTHCKVAWKDSLHGFTTDSPALVDALGNGRLQVAEGTQAGKAGAVFLLNGSNGDKIWSHPVPGMVIGGITSAALSLGGYQDLLVPTTSGLVVLDGRTGAQILAIKGIGLQNSPLVTHDADGLIGLTLAGYNPNGGVILHIDLYYSNGARTNGALADESGAWPMFHHDPQLTGSTIKPLT